MKTTFCRKEDIKRRWHLVDAKDKIVGRLAARIARILMGKHKPDYTPYLDCGDFVVVVNCEKVCFTGKKWEKKIYRHHTYYLGGLVEEPAVRVLKLQPERIIIKAVQRMLPKSSLGERMIRKLKVYAGPQHPHAAQNPVPLVI